MSQSRSKSRSVARWLLLLLLCACMPAGAQRVITPVESNDLPLEVRRRQQEQANRVLGADTVATPPPPTEEKEPKHKAPLFGGLLLTADIASPVMNLFGQQYGNYEVALEADFFHRFFPVVEIGIGYAGNTPDDNNYTYKCAPSLYGRVGMNYNFFYNNGSESFFSLGARYGLTYFSYSWDNVRIDEPYWGSEAIVSIPGQKAFAHWAELVVALRVQVYKNFYMGWSGRYRFMIGCGSSAYGEPMFVPGFGPSAGGFGFTYTIGYRLPIGGSKDKETKK